MRRVGGGAYLSCVVFGRIAGENASKYVLQQPPSSGDNFTAQRRSLIDLQRDEIKSFRVPEREYTLDEVSNHNTKEDLWIVVKGVVLNLTDWVEEHPGGPQALYAHMGKDATEQWEMLHPDEVILRYAAQKVVGRLKGTSITLEYSLDKI